MRTIIAGSRSEFPIPREYLESAIASCGWMPTVVISGTARGADALGEQWAQRNGIPVERFPADWNTYGRSAGHRRNAEMAARAEALIALWDGTSNGTKGMIDLAKKRGLRVFVHYIFVNEKGIL